MIDQSINVSLRGQVAMIIDGGRGLGATIALSLAEAGAAIAPLAHESCELTAVAAMARVGGSNVLGVTASDYSDADALAIAIDDAREYLGPITIFVDTFGVPAALEAVLPDMAEAGWGCIITTTDAPEALEAEIATLHIDPAASSELTATQVRDFCLSHLAGG